MPEGLSCRDRSSAEQPKKWPTGPFFVFEVSVERLSGNHPDPGPQAWVWVLSAASRDQFPVPGTGTQREGSSQKMTLHRRRQRRRWRVLFWLRPGFLSLTRGSKISHIRLKSKSTAQNPKGILGCGLQILAGDVKLPKLLPGL